MLGILPFLNESAVFIHFDRVCLQHIHSEAEIKSSQKNPIFFSRTALVCQRCKWPMSPSLSSSLPLCAAWLPGVWWSLWSPAHGVTLPKAANLTSEAKLLFRIERLFWIILLRHRLRSFLCASCGPASRQQAAATLKQRLLHVCQPGGGTANQTPSFISIFESDDCVTVIFGGVTVIVWVWRSRWKKMWKITMLFWKFSNSRFNIQFWFFIRSQQKAIYRSLSASHGEAAHSKEGIFLQYIYYRGVAAPLNLLLTAFQGHVIMSRKISYFSNLIQKLEIWLLVTLWFWKNVGFSLLF